MSFEISVLEKFWCCISLYISKESRKVYQVCSTGLVTEFSYFFRKNFYGLGPIFENTVSRKKNHDFLCKKRESILFSEVRWKYSRFFIDFFFFECRSGKMEMVLMNQVRFNSNFISKCPERRPKKNIKKKTDQVKKNPSWMLLCIG